MDDGSRVFVKQGVDEGTSSWLKREIEVYAFLKAAGFEKVPKMLSVAEDKSAIVLEALEERQGWNWKPQWSKRRVEKTLEALDELAGLPLQVFGSNIEWQSNVEDDSRPLLIKGEPEEQKILEKLKEVGHGDIAEGFDFQAAKERWESIRFEATHLVHYDIREDNCPYNERLDEVKIVDWNWAQPGDRRLDLAGFLCSVEHSGFDVLESFRDRLDADAMFWLAGYFFRESIQEPWEGCPDDIRGIQIQLGATAYRLSEKLRKR